MFVLPRLAVLLGLLLAAVLVMTQTLGLVHAITHGPSGSSLYFEDEFHDHHLDHHLDHDHDVAKAPGVNHFFVSLFSLHHDVSDCRLFDQASHDGGLAMTFKSALPVVLPPLTVAIFQGEALARWATLFDARGPPLTV